ncbi:EmrB/QacA subfamily drug resistance transporter [Kibdelosporangium banguiense]|uniref:EmrB/QacA subfamily drug resistance transporter n=1 Tax=Kibdelosporangium banguiense TaxID=1365924 RepID=A0ABS4U267_9PSEU|nr:MFS transporter [Kibdelosporangium banguiense]MBP2330715.1 EmrB/QacA subfamily drug resistance transporter [Kibdelosporangium banguiense]
MTRSPGRADSRGAVSVLAFSGILGALMQTIVVPLVAELPRLLNTTPDNASWVITATLLSAAVTTPISGRLGDMFGKRRMLVVCVVLLIMGSVLCALTSSLALVIAGRALQGTATSVVPLGISILRDELPPERVATAISLISATLGVGGSIGLPVSALVGQHLDWHLLFWGTAGVGVIALVLIIVVVPESPVRTPGRFDFVGAIGLAAGLMCVLLALTKGAAWGWTSTRVITLMIAGLVILAAWMWFETRVSQPMVDIRISASRPVLLTNLASIMTGFAMYAIALVLPQLLQAPAETGYGLGQSMVVGGLVLAPSGVVMMLLAPLAARISNQHGPRTTLMAGLVIIAVGYVAGIYMMSSVWLLVLVACVSGAGVGLAFAALPALIMGVVPPTETGVANGLNALMRSVGTSLASAAMALILTNLTMPIGPRAVPTATAFQLTFVAGAVAAVIALVLAAFIPSRARLAEHTPALNLNAGRV